MTTQKVIQQFLARKSAHTPIRDLMWGGRNCSISTDGAKLWSYNTVIAQWGGNAVLINNTKYSRTTSKQQSALKLECKNLNIKTAEM